MIYIVCRDYENDDYSEPEFVSFDRTKAEDYILRMVKSGCYYDGFKIFELELEAE